MGMANAATEKSLELINFAAGFRYNIILLTSYVSLGRHHEARHSSPRLPVVHAGERDSKLVSPALESPVSGCNVCVVHAAAAQGFRHLAPQRCVHAHGYELCAKVRACLPSELFVDAVCSSRHSPKSTTLLRPRKSTCFHGGC